MKSRTKKKHNSLFKQLNIILLVKTFIAARQYHLQAVSQSEPKNTVIREEVKQTYISYLNETPNPPDTTG